MNLLKKTKRLHWSWPDYTLIGLILLFSILLSFRYSHYKQLPSPLYGGDLYHQLASVNHVKYGGNPFKSFSTLEGPPSYFPVYTLLTGGFARIFNLNSMTAMYFTSIIYVILSFIIVYLLFKTIFPKEVAIFSPLIYLPILYSGVLKYTMLELSIVYPLLMLSIIYFFKSKKKILWSIITGFLYGVASLSHAEGFFIVTLLLPFLLLYMLFFQYSDFKKFDTKKIKKEWKKNTLYFLLIFGIGFLLAQIYWFTAIKFALLGKLKMGFGSIAIFKFSDILKLSLTHLFSFRNFQSSLITIFFVIGLIAPLLFKKKTMQMKVIYFSCFILFIIPFHFLITKPLLGFDLVPNHMSIHTSRIILSLISSYGILFLINLFKKQLSRKYFTVSIFLLLLTFTLIGYFHFVNTDKWVKQGENPLSQQIVAAADWINKNTNVNDVFISTKEISSAMNGLTGRKFLTLRFNHNSPFVNLYQREADLAVILYGNNTDSRTKLLNKYHVKYLYWDSFWFSSEFMIGNNGKVIGPFDPITVLNTEYFRNYFTRNGVKFMASEMTIDPSTRGNPDFKTEKVLIAIPANLNVMQPWDDSLNKSLLLVQNIISQNISLAKIFLVQK